MGSTAVAFWSFAIFNRIEVIAFEGFWAIALASIKGFEENSNKIINV